MLCAVVAVTLVVDVTAFYVRCQGVPVGSACQKAGHG